MGGKFSGRIAAGQSHSQRLVANNQLVPDANGNQPTEKSLAQPGSPEKIAILAARSLAGEPLFGNKDANVIISGYEATAHRSTEHLPSRFGGSGVGRPKKRNSD